MAVSVESLREDEDFALLYRRDYQRLVGYCRSMVGPTGDAEDIAQEAFVRAWRSWDRYSEDPRFWALVTTIARRLWIDEVRRAGRATTRRHVEYALSAQPEADPAEHVADVDDGRLARLALESLSPRYQRLLRFRDIEGRAYDEIARIEGTSVGTVATSLRRARLALGAAYRRTSAGLTAALSFGWIGRLRQKVDQSWAHAGAPFAGAAVAVVLTVAPSAHAPGGSTVTATDGQTRKVAFAPVQQRGDVDVRTPTPATANDAASTTALGSSEQTAKNASGEPIASAGPIQYFDYHERKDEVRRYDIVVEVGETEHGPLVGIYANPDDIPPYVMEQTQ